MKEHLIYQTLQRKVPENAVIYCYSLWEEQPFKFIITRKRDSKFGDYRYSISTRQHTITLNEDLNIYAFLVTYLHEVAHLKTTVQHGLRVKPHGEEWKRVFQELVVPLFSENIFPDSILKPLLKYISNPKASSCSDIDLMKALRDFDLDRKEVYLSELKLGDSFKLNKKEFIKLEIKRSRSLCKEISTGRQYWVPEAALVKQIGQLTLFNT